MRLRDDPEFQRLRHAIGTVLFGVVLVLAVGFGVLLVARELTSREEEPEADPPIAAEEGLVRLAGEDRFATAAAVARRLWPDGAATVVLATGLDYPDALAGGPLAASRQAPLLLTPADALTPAVEEALVDLDPDEVLLLGGPAALSEEVAQQVQELPGAPAVERVAGATRYETARAAAARAGREDAQDVAVATGEDYPDALAAGSLTAGSAPVPVLLATGGELVTPLEGDERVLLIGGAGALSEAVAEQAADQAGEVRRLAGAERFATSTAVADHALQTRLPERVPLVVATGEQFADALPAGAAAARAGGPLLLIPGGGPTHEQAAWIRANRDRFNGVLVVGGPSAVADEASARLRNLVRGSSF